MESSRSKTGNRKTPLIPGDKLSKPLNPMVYVRGENPVSPEISREPVIQKEPVLKKKVPSIVGVELRHVINGVMAGWIGQNAVNISIIEKDTLASFKGQVGQSDINLSQSCHGKGWVISGAINTPRGSIRVKIDLTGPVGSRHMKGWIGEKHFYVNEIASDDGMTELKGRYFSWNIYLNYQDSDGNLSLRGTLSNTGDETRTIDIEGSQNPPDAKMNYAGILPAIVLAI